EARRPGNTLIQTREAARRIDGFLSAAPTGVVTGGRPGGEGRRGKSARPQAARRQPLAAPPAPPRGAPTRAPAPPGRPPRGRTAPWAGRRPGAGGCLLAQPSRPPQGRPFGGGPGSITTTGETTTTGR